MARIRSVKPEFFTSETIAALSVPARLTFIGLWTYADDYGRAVDNPKLLKAAVWPLDDDVSAGQVASHLDEFARAGRICRYTVDGKRYLHVVTWEEHQKPKNPSEPKYPACPKQDHGGDGPGEALPQPYPSPTPAEGQDGDSPSLPRAHARSREQGGGAGSRANTVVDPSSSDRPGTLPTAAAIREVWEAYLDACQLAGVSRNARLTPKRRDKIRTRLKAFPLQDVIDAAWGWTRDPWPDRRLHCDAVQVFKTDEHVEKFRDLWRRGPPQVMGRRTQEMLANAQGMRAWRERMEGGGSGDPNGMGADRPATQRELPGPAG